MTAADVVSVLGLEIGVAVLVLIVLLAVFVSPVFWPFQAAP